MSATARKHARNTNRRRPAKGSAFNAILTNMKRELLTQPEPWAKLQALKAAAKGDNAAEQMLRTVEKELQGRGQQPWGEPTTDKRYIKRHLTPDQFEEHLVEVRTRIHALESLVYWHSVDGPQSPASSGEWASLMCHLERIREDLDLYFSPDDTGVILRTEADGPVEVTQGA